MAYTTAEGGYGASGSVFHFAAAHSDTIVIPDAELLFTGDFKRHGPDLILTGHDGRHHIVPGYFSSEKHPALVAPNGASLSAALVDLLAGSPTPGQFAQASPTPTDPIGKVEKVVGHVVVIRNGVAIALNVGDAVYKSDIIQTGANSSCGLDFPDGTALNLVANTRMALNDYSYDPNGNSNDALFSLVQGTFAFVAGKVAHTGDMKIETPVATMGIRGTTGFVQEQIGTISANIGNVTYSFAVVEDYGTGRVGQYELIDPQGNVVATVSQNGFLTYITPQGTNLPPIVTTQPMSNTQLGFEQQIIQQVFQVLNSGTNPNPQTPNGNNGSSTQPSPLHNLPQLLQNNGNGTTFTVGGNGSGSQSSTSNTQSSNTTAATPTVTWVGSFGGDWNNPYNWSDGVVPLAWEVVDLSSKATLSGGATVAGLIISSSGILNIVGGGDLTLSNSLEIAQFGALQLNSSGVDPTLAISGTVKLTGGGTVYLLGTGDNNIVAAKTGAILTNLADTIAGSGTIGAGDQTLTLVNGVDLVKGTHGTIDATPLLPTDSGILTIHTGNLIDNSGVMEATAGGTLKIADDVDNSGGVASFGGTVSSPIISTVSFESVTVTNESGGVIGTQGTGASITFTDGIVVNGGVIATNGGAVTFTDSTVTNNTLVDLASGSPGINADGGGTITFDGGSATNNGLMAAHDGSLIVFENGQVDNTVGFLLAGAVEGIAAYDGGTITFSGEQVTNTGLIVATVGTGGTIEITNTTIANAGGSTAADDSGVIVAGAGSTIELSGATILQGTVLVDGAAQTLAAGEIETVGGSSNTINTADGSNIPAAVTISNQGIIDIVDNSSLTLAAPETIFNSGTIELSAAGNAASDATTLYFDQPFAGINGSGQITLSNSKENFVSVSTPNDQLTNVDNTISGAGTIGGGGMVLVNDATIDATGTNPLVIDAAGTPSVQGQASLTNNGTLEATSGATLVIASPTVDNTNGTISAVGAHSVVQLSGSAVTGGIITTSGGGALEATSGTEEISGVTNFTNNQLTVDAGATLTLSGDVLTGGTITIDAGGTLDLVNTTITGNATLQLEAGGFFNVSGTSTIDTFKSVLTGTATVAGGQTLIVEDELVSGSISDQGTVEIKISSSIDGGSITESGSTSLVKIDAPQQLTVEGGAEISGGPVTNLGAIIVAGAATFSSATVTNTGATITVNDTDTLTLADSSINGGTINDFSGTSGGNIDVTGTGLSEIVGTSSADAQLNGGSAGAVTLDAGLTLGDVKLSGISIENGTTLTSGPLTLDAAVEVADASTLAGLTIDGNSNTITVDSGQTLTLDTDTLNTVTLTGGTDDVSALTIGGSSEIDNATVSGGTITVDSGQTLTLDTDTLNTVTLTGGTDDVSALTIGSSSEIDNAIVSGGTITVDSGQTLTLDTDTLNTVTLTGGTDDVSALTIGSSSEIDNATVSGGTITVDSGQTLTLDTDTLNTVTLTGGTDDVSAVTIGSSSEIDNATISGGIVTVDSGQTLTLDTDTLQTVTLTGGTDDVSALTIGGSSEIDNATVSGGIVTVDSGQTLTLDTDTLQTVTLTGGTDDVTALTIGSNSEIDNATVSGGTITVDSGQTLTLDTDTLQTVTLTGGTDDVSSLTIGSNSEIETATVSGGTITVDSGQTLTLDTDTLNTVTLTGGTDDVTALTIGSSSEIDNAAVSGGTITVDSGQTLTLDTDTLNTVTLTGGTDDVSALTIGSSSEIENATVSGGTITVDSGQTLTLDTDTLQTVTLTGGTDDVSALTIGTNSEIDNATVSGGTITVDSGQTLTLDTDTLNTVTLTGGTDDVSAVTIGSSSEIDNATISGGIVTVDSGQTLTLDTDTLQTVTLTGGTDDVSALTIGGSSEIDNATVSGGIVTVDSGQTLTLDTDTLQTVTLTGGTDDVTALTIGSNSEIDNATVSGGTITVDSGQTLTLDTDTLQTVTLTGGTDDVSSLTIGSNSEIETATVSGGTITVDSGQTLTLDTDTLQTVTLTGGTDDVSALTIGSSSEIENATVSGGTITVDSGQTLTLDTDMLNTVTLTGGTDDVSAVTIGSSSEIENATVSGGTITVDSGQTLTLDTDMLNTVTLTGGTDDVSAVTIGSNSEIENATVSGGTLTAGGAMLSFAGVTLDDVTLSDTASGSFVNLDTLTVGVDGVTLDGATISNTSTTIDDGGTLSVTADSEIDGGTIDGGGTLTASGATLSFAGVTLDDVTLSDTASGSFVNLDTLTVGVDGVTLDGATITGGNIIDNGIVVTQSASTNSMSVNSLAVVGGAFVDADSGTLTITETQSGSLNSGTIEALDGGTLTINHDNGGSSTNAGTIKADGGTVNLNDNLGTSNSGLVEAVDGGTININLASSLGSGGGNSGTVEANGGTVVITGEFTDAGIDNAGGNIEALGTGVVQLSNAGIGGGRLTTDDPTSGDAGLIEIVSPAAGGSNVSVFNGATGPGNPGQLDVDAYVKVQTGADLVLIGDIDNTGIIDIASAVAPANTLLVVDNTVALSGAGAVTLEGSGAAIVGSVTGTANVLDNSSTIQGAGSIVGALKLDNQTHGVVDATGTSPLVIDTGAHAITNAGTLEASDLSTLHIESAVTNSGTIDVDDGGTVEFDSITITNTNTIEVNAAIGSGVSLSATYLEIAGTVTLQGGAGSATGPGTVTLTDSYNNFIDSNGAAAELINADNTLSGAGTIGDANLTLNNEQYGIIDATETNPLILNTGAHTITNAGTLEATNGSTLDIDSKIDNSNTIAANGGTVDVAAAVTETGAATISSNGILEFQASVAATQTVTFEDATGTLAIGDAADFHATVTGPASRVLFAGDTIDLTNTTVTSAVWDGIANTLDINGVQTAFNISGLPAGNTFEFQSDNQTGTNLMVVPLPTIAGTAGGQTTTSEAAVTPFSGVTIGDANNGGTNTDTLTITYTAGDGTLADGANFTGTSSLTEVSDGHFTLTGTAAAISSELDQLSFTPADGVPNTSVTTTFTLSDTSAAYASATTDSTTTVIDSDPAVAPTIAGTAGGQTTTSEAAVTPFSGVTIGDANNGGTNTDTLTITYTAGDGTLADGANFTGTSSLTEVSDGHFTLTGTAAAISSELDQLSFTPADGVPNTSVTTTFTLSDTSAAYASATTDSTTTVIDSDPAVAPTIAGTAGGQTTTSEAAVTPFSGVTIGDANNGGTNTDTLTITYTAGDGTLADGANFTGTSSLTEVSDGHFTLTGTAAAISSELDQLSFTPADGVPNTSVTTTFTLSDTSAAYASATTDSTTTVIDSDPAVAPTVGITNNNLSVDENGNIALGISETPATSGDPVTVTISGIPSDAALSDSNGDTLAVTGGSITLTPPELAGLTLNAGATSGTLTVTANEMSAEAGTGTPVAIVFDAVNTSAAPVAGIAVADFLAGYGITLTTSNNGAEVSVSNQNQIYGGGIVEATTGYNVIGESGGTGGAYPVSYTLTFATPLTSFAFDQVIENSGPSGSSYAAWSATAYNAAGDVVDTLGDPNVSYVFSGSNPGQTYTLTGSEITSVTFTGNDEGFAGFANIVTDNWVLTPDSTLSSASQTISLTVETAGDPPIAPGATLSVAGASNLTFGFTGVTGTLVLNDPENFTGTITGFTGTAPDATHSDVVDLAGIDETSTNFTHNYNSTTGVLTVSDGTNSASLTFVDFTGTFKFGSDGSGGTDIYDPPVANNPSPPVSVSNDRFVFDPNLGGDAAGTITPDSGAHDHLTSAHSAEWSALIAVTQEVETVEVAQPAESHWHHALHNATHLH